MCGTTGEIAWICKQRSVMSKPREFAHYLIRNKFGSADNINSLSILSSAGLIILFRIRRNHESGANSCFRVFLIRLSKLLKSIVNIKKLKTGKMDTYS
ncbi:hypothetical protein BC332_34908 [Capsicum chinense]|nr:hypothetical protein BC332_34908 [Capsicum chinense]